MTVEPSVNPERPEEAGSAESPLVAARRRRRWPRLLGYLLLGLLALLVVAIAVVWTQRRPLASDILARELAKRGVQATYHLDRVGLRTQQVSNLVIGDPRRPDLTARIAQVQMRILLNGRVEIYRVVARGVRLNGRFVGNKVSWGQLDKLLPTPSTPGKPFTLPDIAVDLADTSIALATPFGPLGVAVEGAGNLTGGFKGRLAASSPRLAPGRCSLEGMRATVRLAVIARRPQVTGPVSATGFSCPTSNIAVAQPRFDVDVSFSEAFERFLGKARVGAAGVHVGVNALAGMNGTVSVAGDPTRALGKLDVAALGARLADVSAARTRLSGSYLLNARRGEITLVSDYAVQGVSLAPTLTAGFTDSLGGAKGTPLEPLAVALRQAVGNATRDMAANGSLRLVNFTGGGAVRVETANVRSASGARIQVAGGDGITYYWPSKKLRLDGTVATEGGGLPTARIALRMPRGGGPVSGRAELAPYSAGGARLALAPVTFAAQANGGTSLDTVVVLDGPLAGGRVQGLRFPVNGSIGPGSALAFGRGCVPMSFTALQLGSLQLGRTTVPVCATGQAIVTRQANGAIGVGAFANRLAVAGRLGSSPFFAQTQRLTMLDTKRFDLTAVRARLGNPAAPILLDAANLKGSFIPGGLAGMFSGGDGIIGKVPLKMTEARGDWRFVDGRLSVAGGLTANDIGVDPPRFYALRSEDFRFLLDHDLITASGSLHQPSSRTLVTNVAIRHRLSSGVGGATLDVPGIRFSTGGLQPEQLTRLSEGVIALVNGEVHGQGRIDWNNAQVTSTGSFTTDNMDLAAAFGPVTGLKGTINFSDLLGLETAPGQTLSIASLNPGIEVLNGTVRYQLLPGQLVRIEEGRWPFMGGTLILQETVLNLGKPSAKRLTFRVEGLDANQFVQSFGFKEISAEGVFDGVLPMIFDENGGRIVGGRLDSRAPGGRLSYNGTVSKADLGTAGNLVFNALKDLRYRSMIIRLDGDLAGEFGTRLTVDGVSLAGSTGTQRLIQRVINVPLKFNVSIRGPFRALINMAKSMRDPRELISTTLEVPLENIPGITTEVRRKEDEQTQTQTPVVDQTTAPAR
ncbi:MULTISPECIES: intermembrane phospholipid transport protein YdbH family protein [Sphingomonas]|uniref:intermembrane phospholipid transport protein YdbH family protein n=1 Tax=Sphingomonas TaxID=13687 RepID=UPI0013B36738|nr:MULTISPECIES: YdbH domain-containing protein [Sphingomonas]